MAKTQNYSGLEATIDRLVGSYESRHEINNLESAAMPNKRTVVEAFNHLKPVIYMGFYSTRALNRDNLRHSISEHLYPAYELLTDQIRRAVTYEQRAGRMCGSRDAEWSRKVVLGLFDTLPELRQTLDDDLAAAYDGDPVANSVEEIVFSYPSIEAITAHRIANALHREGVPIIPRIISSYAHSQTGADIHPAATIGRRFFIDHGTGVVIGSSTVIGQNVKIYQGVTLGALSTRRSPAARSAKRHPTLEDDVTIYAGATILGGDTVIGARSVVGGNVFLTRSVPADSKIFGRPRE